MMKDSICFSATGGQNPFILTIDGYEWLCRLLEGRKFSSWNFAEGFMDYTIERITVENYSKFDDMVFYRENGFQREPSNAAVSQQMTDQLYHPDFYVYAIDVENRFVGWISMIYIPKIGSRWNGRGHLYVDELWVAPDYRNNGFAKALLKKADELQAKLNTNGIRLYVNINNPTAHGLYKSCGYAEDGQAVFMEKKS